MRGCFAGVQLFCVLLFFPASGAALEFAAAEAFFDFDPGPGLGIPLSITAGSDVSFLESVGVSSLAPGNHTLYVRFRDELGVWSAPGARRFGVMPPTASGSDYVAAGETFFDSDPGPGNGDPLWPWDGSFGEPEEEMKRLTSVTGLDTGRHVVYARIRDACGMWSGLAAETLRVVIAHAVAQPDSTAERVRVGWTDYPEAILYQVHFDSAWNGPFAGFVTVSPPETSIWIPVGIAGRSRFYKVRALLPDPSPEISNPSPRPKPNREQP